MENNNYNQSLKVRIYKKDSHMGLAFLREETLSDETVKIGKGTAATLRIDDESLALMHAFITREPSGEVVLADLGSGKETLLNGRSVQRSVLSAGDEISVGEYVLLIGFEVEAVAPLPAEVGAEPALLVTTSESGHTVKKSVLRAPRPASRRAALVSIVAGAVLIFAAAALGVASIGSVNEEMQANAVIRDIAKEQGLSDKFIPKARGNDGFAISALALFIFGSFGIFGGAALLFTNSRRKDRFTVGEDPRASYSMNSRGLPDTCFPVARLYEGAMLVHIPGSMDINVVREGGKRLKTDLVASGEAVVDSSLPNTLTYTMRPGERARVSRGEVSWDIAATSASKLSLPMALPRELFHLQMVLWIVVMAGMGFYFAHLQKDELFGDTAEAGTPDVPNIYKAPQLLIKEKVAQKKPQPKDKEEVKSLYRPSNSTAKNTVSVPRDPRNTSSAGKSGGGEGANRTAGPAGSGVMNVFASQLSTMTASLTASNTVFGQESEDFNDLLGDGDPDGEQISDTFGGRGGPGGAPTGGGLGIPGNGGPGWGGIDPTGGKWTPGVFNHGPGITRRPIHTRDGQAQVFGKLDPNEVRQVIRSHRSQVHHCYQKGLLADNSLRGVIRIAFFITTAGRAQGCSVTDNLAIPTVGSCICASVSNWKFPQPQGGLARIAYSWTLSPGN